MASLLPGMRRTLLTSAISAQLVTFGERILSFDTDAAVACAGIIAGRRPAGRPIAVQDAQIAVIAASSRMTLATRKLHDFALTGIESIDPWTA